MQVWPLKPFVDWGAQGPDTAGSGRTFLVPGETNSILTFPTSNAR